MAQREGTHQRPNRPDSDDTAAAGTAQAKTGSTDADVDAILDEIDDVLEENAEEFVRSFVQKGGQ